ncbi:MAG: PD-(D/E)XK nuclease family protein [Elusimicrobia bacterium]|nr:PD-(D/E)XK nuclease family protein [Elusimicrobiota bacterium]
MKLAARLLRVVLAAALLAPSSAFAQVRASVPGASAGAPTVVPSFGAGLSAPSVAAPSLSAPSLSLTPVLAAPSIVPSAASPVPSALKPAAVAAAKAATLAGVVPSAQKPVDAQAPARLDALTALRDMPAALESAPAAGAKFDGAKVRDAADEPVEPETVTSEISDQNVQDDLALWFTRKQKADIKKDQVYALVRPVLGNGSRRYWEKFEEKAPLVVKVAGQGMFMSRVTYARTVPINRMTLKDFEGVYSKSMLRGKTIYKLRAKLIAELNERNARTMRGQSGVVTQLSEVRVVRVMPFGQARLLPENKDEETYAPVERKKYELPAALQGLNHMSPKVVFLDMRLFKDGVPYPLIEDMTKLMKAGMYFVLLSDKPNDAPGSVEEQLTRGLTMKQKDQISRYKMVVLADDGNALQSYDGAFARYLPSRRFSNQEQELMRFAAGQVAMKGDTVSHGTEFVAYLNSTNLADGGALASLKNSMKLNGLPVDGWQFSVGEKNGRRALIVRPQSLASAIPHLLESLREYEGLYVNPSDIMTISRDEALLAATKGSVQPSTMLEVQGAELADASISAVLGPYRENRPGDLAASASKIQSFIYNPDRVGGGAFNGGSIYMMMGHVMHSAFNWAVWTYRNTGVFPSADETVAAAERIWLREEADRTGKNIDRPGENLAGFHEVMVGRMRTMHAVTADILKVYPIAIGTELSNMLVFDNYKKGVPDNRDILRLIFDFVVAREMPDGTLEVAVLDFKTGQTPTLQNLEKDTQVQLYDLAIRKMWPKISVPYGALGERRQVSDYKIRFIYPSSGYQPILNEWSRIKFERFLRNVMNRIRKHNAPPAPKPEAKAKRKPKAKAAAKK